MTAPTAAPPVAPFEVYSVHFDFPGGQAIKLKDPSTDLIVGRNPEWDAGGRNALAAYVRATRPEMQVVFRGAPAADGFYTIGADGTPCQVQEQQVRLVFDPGTGLSNAFVFRASVSLPDRIGVHLAKLDWYIRVQAVPAHCLPVGTSTHRLATSWRRFTTPPAGETGPPSWVYWPLMEWTCQWAAGQNDEKAICDAIIANVRHSGLQYGVDANDVRDMLLVGGGMCGVWYQAFQQMAHCQGVFVYRRQFYVHWRTLARGEEQWCAIVICRGGLNQAQPTDPPSEFHDNDTGFPIAAPVPIMTRTEPRYRFYGAPDGFWADGHCINFLEYGGRLYLYDACFGKGPFEIDTPLPVPDPYIVRGGVQLRSFKERYFDDSVEYMLGSLHNGAVFLKTTLPTHLGTGTNGMTVRTRHIPETMSGIDGLTCRWGD